MFGYVLPDKNYLYLKDYQLYQGVYCGICKSIKRQFGNIPRLATNYDSVFLSVLVHNLAGLDFSLRKERCILHPVRKRPVAADDALTKQIAGLNVLLLHHKLCDDVIDDGLLKYKMGRAVFRGAYKKAKKIYPDLDAIIAEEYERLRALEKEREPSFDRAADPFGCMMRRVCEKIFIPNQFTAYADLCYNIGKWIYLIDALDDLEKDHKSGNYNPYLAAWQDFDTLEGFLQRHQEQIGFSLYTGCEAVTEAAELLGYKFNADLIKNVTERGMKVRTKILLENDCKCKKIRM